jgi:hypothetical protein
MHEFILFTKVHSNFIHQISFTKFNDKVISFMSISSCVNHVSLKALWLFNANKYNAIRGLGGKLVTHVTREHVVGMVSFEEFLLCIA